MAALSSVFPVTGLLLFGTITSLFAKIVYELHGVGREGESKLFRKPWAMTTVMFLGMTMCLPLAYWNQYQRKKAALSDNTEVDSLLRADSELAPLKEQSELREVCLLAIPTVFDLMATILMNIGLLSVTASVYQMMRGAEMLFAAAFSVLFLHRTLNRNHYIGISCCVVGICLVGAASLLSGDGGATTVSTWQMFGGMSLIVVSQAVQAAQITFEDFFLSSMNISPLKIVGFEGLWGSAAMLLVLLPIVQRLPGKDGGGVHEDSLDTLHMIGSNGVLVAILLIDMAALLFYNVSGMCVTGNLGAVFRTVLETTRTLFVWLVGLLLFYTPLGFGQLGERWTVFSFMQAAGFVVLVGGTMIYGRGDENEEKVAMQEMQAHADDVISPPPTPGARAMPARRLYSSVSFARTPSGATQPILMTPSSMKSTMNINAFRGSYPGPGSFVGSYAGPSGGGFQAL